MSEISKHLAHYLSLLGMIGVGLWGLMAFSYDKNLQSAISVSLGLGFVAWGVIHHWIHEDLYPKIVLEYIATAILGVVILLSVFWSA